MKKILKIILLVIVIVLIFLSASKGINKYLYGEPMPFNGILVSGDKESVNEAKEAFKDNTKYTKDYRYKIVTVEKESVDENGEAIVNEKGEKEKYTHKYLVMTKDTAKAMLEDQILRERREDTKGLESDLLKELPDIKDGKSLVFQKGYYFNENEQKVELEKTIDLNGKELEVTYGGDWRIGFIPDGMNTIVTDDDTYKDIDAVDASMSLIRFEKGTKDYRKAKDQKEIIDKLSDIDNLDVDTVDSTNLNYVFIKE